MNTTNEAAAAARIKQSLEAAVRQEPRVDPRRDHIEIAFVDGVGTLSGEVGDVAAKARMREIAARLPEVKRIVDRLRVRPLESMSDRAIEDHVARALLHDSVFGECGIGKHVGATLCALRPAAHCTWWIELRAQDGIVTLDGNVPTFSHKRLAGAMAWWAPGVRDVLNVLVIDPEQTDSDQQIVEGLRLVLEKDPRVDATNLRASCRDSVVTLEGRVANHAARDAAELDAWALFGVAKVVARIEIEQLPA